MSRSYNPVSCVSGTILLLAFSLLPARAERVTVFAAASLTGALRELWPRERHPEMSLSFGGSSMLARQIEAGAPADLYLSASLDWMDHLQARGHIDSTTRIDLLGNHLVVVAPRDEGFALTLAPTFDIGGAFAGRLALGDPSHVPAGIYAMQTLQALGWWPALAHRLAPAGDVRAVLAWVERGECAAGIVYTSDATTNPRVQIVATIPDSLHIPIRYPVALVAGPTTAAARRRLDTLRSPAAQAVFHRHGFTVLTAQ